MVKRSLDWVLTFSKATADERTRMRKLLLEGVRRWRKGIRYANDPVGDKITEEGESLFRSLTDKSKVDFVGFTTGIDYFKESGSKADHDALYVHPFGGPHLLYKVKDAPMMIIVSPSLRFNGSHIKEVDKNRYIDTIMGITD